MLYLVFLNLGVVVLHIITMCLKIETIFDEDITKEKRQLLYFLLAYLSANLFLVFSAEIFLNSSLPFKELFLVIYFFGQFAYIFMSLNMFFMILKFLKRGTDGDLINVFLANHKIRNQFQFSNGLYGVFSIVIIAGLGLTKLNSIDANTFNNVFLGFLTLVISLLIPTIIKRIEKDKNISKAIDMIRVYDISQKNTEARINKYKQKLAFDGSINAFAIEEKISSLNQELKKEYDEVWAYLKDILD